MIDFNAVCREMLGSFGRDFLRYLESRDGNVISREDIDGWIKNGAVLEEIELTCNKINYLLLKEFKYIDSNSGRMSAMFLNFTLNKNTNNLREIKFENNLYLPEGFNAKGLQYLATIFREIINNKVLEQKDKRKIHILNWIVYSLQALILSAAIISAYTNYKTMLITSKNLSNNKVEKP